MNNEYTFFWRGVFSQWSPSRFVFEAKEFNCAEQAMMYHKAVLFGDFNTAGKIMATPSPKDQQALGREVANFCQATWNAFARQLVVDISVAKFSQNKGLWEILDATGNTTLVEASPKDKIWGIGLAEEVAKKTPADQWVGTNWLGLALTEAREIIRENNSQQSDGMS
jgi:hypothetical protein